MATRLAACMAVAAVLAVGTNVAGASAEGKGPAPGSAHAVVVAPGAAPAPAPALASPLAGPGQIRLATPGPSVGTPPLVNHGGAIQRAVRLYAIFWGPGWTSNPGFGRTAVTKLLHNLGGSAYAGLLAQYNGAASVSVTLNGNWIDPNPPSGTVTRSTIIAEIARASRVNGWSADIHDQYVVLPQPGSHYGDVIDGYSPGSWCAYHDSYIDAATGRRPAYDLIGYQGDSLFSGCRAYYGAGVTYQAMTTITSHEFSEAATDTYGTGYYTSDDYEIGDVCAYQGVLSASTGVYVQYEWDNRINACNAA